MKMLLTRFLECKHMDFQSHYNNSNLRWKNSLKLKLPHFGMGYLGIFGGANLSINIQNCHLDLQRGWRFAKHKVLLTIHATHYTKILQLVHSTNAL